MSRVPATLLPKIFLLEGREALPGRPKTKNSSRPSKSRGQTPDLGSGALGLHWLVCVPASALTFGAGTTLDEIQPELYARRSATLRELSMRMRRQPSPQPPAPARWVDTPRSPSTSSSYSLEHHACVLLHVCMHDCIHAYVHAFKLLPHLNKAVTTRWLNFSNGSC